MSEWDIFTLTLICLLGVITALALWRASYSRKRESALRAHAIVNRQLAKLRTQRLNMGRRIFNALSNVVDGETVTPLRIRRNEDNAGAYTIWIDTKDRWPVVAIDIGLTEKSGICVINTPGPTDPYEATYTDVVTL